MKYFAARNLGTVYSFLYGELYTVPKISEFFDKLEAILGRNVRPRKPGQSRKAGDTL
jgi:hypothetical protein